MNTTQLNTLYNRHDPTRRKIGMTWESYLYKLIADGMGFYEVVDLAGRTGVSNIIMAELEVRLWERIGNPTITARAVLRWSQLLAQSA